MSLDSTQSISAVRGLIQATSYYDGRLNMHCFTFDHENLHDRLMAVGHRSGRGRYALYVDHASFTDSQTGKGTIFMAPRVRQLSDMDRLAVYVTRGIGCRDAYVAAGRDKIYSGPGKHHCKTVRSGFLEVTGSANWTVATEGNHERGVLRWLTLSGARAADRHEENVRRTAVSLQEYDAVRRVKVGAVQNTDVLS